MDGKNKGHENLIPFNERTVEEQRRIQRKGGKASGKARREKADLRKMMKIALDEKIGNKDLTHGERLIQSVLNIAENPKNGASAIRAFETILRMIGQDLPDVGENNITDEVREAVERLVKNVDVTEQNPGD